MVAFWACINAPPPPPGINNEQSLNIFRLTYVKLTIGLENFKGVVRDDLSLASAEIDKNY